MSRPAEHRDESLHRNQFGLRPMMLAVVLAALSGLYLRRANEVLGTGPAIVFGVMFWICLMVIGGACWDAYHGWRKPK